MPLSFWRQNDFVILIAGHEAQKQSHMKSVLQVTLENSRLPSPIVPSDVFAALQLKKTEP
jgi:hypothetical protein